MQRVEITEPTESVDIAKYLAILRQWAWLIILATILSAVITFIVTSQMVPIYQATTTVLVNEAPSNKTADYTSIMTSERLSRTYTSMMTKQPVLNEVIDKLQLSTKVDLTKKITVQPIKDTQLITIFVEDSNPQLARDIANTLVDVFSKQISDLQTDRFAASKKSLQVQIDEMDKQIQDTTELLANADDQSEKTRLDAKLANFRDSYSNLVLNFEQIRLSEAQTTSNVVLVEPATAPEIPIRPKIPMNTALAALVGLILSLASVFAIEAMDDTLKTPDDISRILNLPVLSVITHHTNEDGNPITIMQPRAPVSEAFRTLRTNVQFTSVDTPLQTILITSPSPSEGKTTTAVNLGIVLAQSGKKVILIDADLRRPSVHRRIGLENQKGLSSLFVRQSVTLENALQKTRIPGFFVISSGNLPPNPSELLGSKKMKNILDKVKEEIEIVLVDTPPALAVTDAVVMVPYVDGVLLVMKPGKTKQSAARQCVDQLRRAGANLIGVVLNDVEMKRSRYGYYYHKNYHYYESYEENKANP